MRRRKIASIDQNTGEILKGILVYCGVKQNPYSTGWVMNSQEALEIIAKDKEITGGVHRVLWFIIARLDYENWIQISQQEICEELGMKKQNVSSAIKLLEQKEIILRGPKVSRSYAFRLNPYFGWKGKVKNLDDYRQKEEDEHFKEKRQETLKIDREDF